MAQGAAWQPLATLPNPLVGGGLELAPQDYAIAPDAITFQGRGLAPSTTTRPVSYTWTGRVIAVPGTAWLRLEATLRLCRPAYLAWPPELLLWLGTFSTMNDRQWQIWRGLIIANPTVNASGQRGNDLPAVYWYDFPAKAEVIVFADLSVMDWFTSRFLTYRCAERREYAPRPRYGVGLVATEPADVSLPAGDHTFAWWLWEGPRADTPTSWQALEMLVEAAEPLLPAAAPFPAGATSWGDFAGRCLNEVQAPDTCWTEVQGVRGQRAYVKGTSEVWQEPAASFELMTQLDVLTPLSRYLVLHPHAGLQAHYDALRASLSYFHRPEIHFVSNHFPPPAGNEVVDSWYTFENALIKLAWFAHWSGDAVLAAIAQDALAGATELAHRVNYLFPLFYNADTLKPVKGLTNYAVGGFYAYAHLLAHDLAAEPQKRRTIGSHVHPVSQSLDHLSEARAALNVLCRLPLDLLHHEPQELGFAALAASRLAELDGDDTWRETARGFLTAELRMGYWYSDPFARQRGYDNLGMFQACAALLYPAFKENVESVLPWPGLLKRGIGGETLLKFLNLQRANNFYYFDPCLPPELRRPSTCPHIPYEDLGTLELPSFGSIGKEIYGAGETVWLYLMLEALGHADDREVLVVYLDLLEPSLAFPPADREFLVYNPTPAAKACRFVVPHLPPGRYVVTAVGMVPYLYAADDLAAGVPLVLEPREQRRVAVQKR